MFLMKLAEMHCVRTASNNFWWRVFTPSYSRNIWCELLMIVGFRGTTVCLVRGERRNLVEKRCSKSFLEIQSSVCHHHKAAHSFLKCLPAVSLQTNSKFGTKKLSFLFFYNVFYQFFLRCLFV